MKLTQIVESKQALVEQHRRNGLVLLVESCQGLTEEQSKVVKGIYKELLPLIEASLSPEQIKQLFGAVEQGVTAGGANRTVLGKGKDVAVKANEIINNIGKWLQDTKPVQAFDQKFEDLKTKVGEKFPEVSNKLSALGQYAKENPGKTAAVIGVLTALASIAAGPMGGAIAGQVLKGATELLKGEKLSTAIGKGAKAAALGWLTGKAVEALGSIISKPIQMVADKMDPGLTQANFTSTIQEIGGKFGDRFEVFDTGPLVGRPEDVKDILTVYKDAVSSWKAGDYMRADSMFKSAAEMTANINSQDYVAQLALDTAKAQEVMDAAKNTASFFNQMAAVAQGAATGAASNEPKQESKFYQTRPLSEGQVYMLFKRVDFAQDYLAEAGIMDKIKGAAGKVAGKLKTVGHNLTTKVTADKLTKAWQQAGAPTDSQEIYDFLVQQGVDPEVIAPVYSNMKLPTPKDTSQKFGIDTQQPAAAEPAAQEPAAQQAAPDNTIGLQTQEPAQAAPKQTAKPASEPAQEPAAQPAQVDIVKLADAIKKVQPSIVPNVVKMLDSDPGLAKKKPAKPQAQQPQQPATA